MTLHGAVLDVGVHVDRGFAIPRTSGEISIIERQNAYTSSMNVSAGKMSCTRPMVSARSALTRIPAIAMYFAHAGPTMRASRLVPPLPAIAPSRTSGTPNWASGTQNRKSHDPPISTPAPRQMPFTASTIGFSTASNSS